MKTSVTDLCSEDNCVLNIPTTELIVLYVGLSYTSISLEFVVPQQTQYLDICSESLIFVFAIRDIKSLICYKLLVIFNILTYGTRHNLHADCDVVMKRT